MKMFTLYHPEPHFTHFSGEEYDFCCFCNNCQSETPHTQSLSESLLSQENKSFMKKHVFLHKHWYHIDVLLSSFPKKYSSTLISMCFLKNNSAMKPILSFCKLKHSVPDGKSPLIWGRADFTKPRGNPMWTQVSLLGGNFYCRYCLIPLNCQK